MIIFIALCGILTASYLTLLFSIRQKWIDIPENSRESSLLTDPDFLSIIIVARNEAKHIRECLQSITANHYPKDKYEIILVDDDSTDATIESARSLKIQNLTVVENDRSIASTSFKKTGQHLGASISKGDLLLFTDGDVKVPKYWIVAMVEELSIRGLNMATGPVKYEDTSSWLKAFQALDVAGTMLMTAAGINDRNRYLANGANMIVNRKSYFDYYQNSNHHFASGDDVFLIQHLAEKNPSQVGFVKSKNAIVITYPEQSLADLYRQRLRWASKTGGYSDFGLKRDITLIYLFNILIIGNVMIGIFHNPLYLILSIAMINFKIIGDLFLLKEAKNYFNLSIPIYQIPLYSLLQCIYIIVIGTAALFSKKYIWKGREVQ